jgi:hypothetical protein
VSEVNIPKAFAGDNRSELLQGGKGLNRDMTVVDMNGIFQMQGGKNRILPKYINAKRFFWDSHWLEIWSNHFCPSMGLNGGSVATDSNTSQLLLIFSCSVRLINKYEQSPTPVI